MVAQRRYKLGRGAESCLADDVADAAVEALDHAIRLWVAWRNEAVFNGEVLAQHVEHMLAGRGAVAGHRMFLLAREAASKLGAVAGEQVDYVDRAGVFHLNQEGGTAAVRRRAVSSGSCHPDTTNSIEAGVWSPSGRGQIHEGQEASIAVKVEKNGIGREIRNDSTAARKSLLQWIR